MDGDKLFGDLQKVQSSLEEGLYDEALELLGFVMGEVKHLKQKPQVTLEGVRRSLQQLVSSEKKESPYLDNLRDAQVYLECAQHNLEMSPVFYRVRPQIVVKVKS